MSESRFRWYVGGAAIVVVVIVAVVAVVGSKKYTATNVNDPPIKGHGNSILIQMTNPQPDGQGGYYVSPTANGTTFPKNFICLTGVTDQNGGIPPNVCQANDASSIWKIEIYGYQWHGLSKSSKGFKICSEANCDTGNPSPTSNMWVTPIDSDDDLSVDNEHWPSGPVPPGASQHGFHDDRFACKMVFGAICNRIYELDWYPDGKTLNVFKCPGNTCTFSVGGE